MAKYIGPDGYEYTAEQLKSYPKPSMAETIGNTVSSMTQAVVNFSGRNIQGQTQEDRVSALAGAYDVYGKRSADDAALTAEAGRILNLEPGTFIGAKSEIQQAAKQVLQLKKNSPDDWNQFVVDYPKTTEYLTNNSNMAISHDDINNLSYQEQILSTMSNAYKLNTLNQERAEIGNNILGSVYGMDALTTEQKDRLIKLDTEIKSLQEKLPESTWSLKGILAGIAGMVPSAETGIKYGAAGAAIGAGAGALAGGVGAIPGALTGLSQGFRIGFAKDFAATSAGNLYLNELLKGVDPTEAAKGAAVSGVGTAVLSTAQVGKWIKLPEATQAGIKSLGLNVLEQSAIGAGLTATELAGQKVAEGKTLNWGMHDISQIAEGGINMIPIALAMALPGHAYIGLKQLGNIVDQSKTYQRSPELMAEKINAEVEGTPLENVSIPGQELVDYLQKVAESDPKEAQIIITRLDVDIKEIKEAVETGGDIEVKLGNFEILPKQHREALLEDVKVGNQPSAKEIKEVYGDKLEEPQDIQRPNIAQEIGLDTIKFYSESAGEAKIHSDKVLTERSKAENNPSFQKKLNTRLEEVKKEVESQLEVDPLYRASSSLSFDLQMFGAKIKNVKEVAEKYINGKLTDTQKYFIDTVAEQHGFSSGSELVKNIRNNKLKDDELKTRLNYAAEQFKKEELGEKETMQAEAEISEAKIRTTAAEAETLRRMSSGEHRQIAREKAVSDAVSRFKDAEARLLVEIQKAKDEAKIQELKDRLSELEKQHKEEVNQLNKESKYTARWYEAEANKKESDLKERQKHDSSMAKEWLKAELTSQKIARSAEVGIKAALDYAKISLAEKPVNEAIAFGKYMKQAREAARKSEKEYRAGKYEEAAKWKNSEMVNHAMALESMKINKDFTKQERYIKNVVSKKIDLFKTQENFSQVGSLLERFGVGRKDYSPNTKQETLQKWSDRMDEMLGSVNIAEWIYDESIRKNYKDLTMPELKDLTDALKNIQKVANQEKTSIAVAKGESLDKLRLEQIEEMNKNLDTAYKPEMEQSLYQKTKQSVYNYLYDLQTFSTVIGRLQGWKTFGSLEEFWIKPVHERANLESNRINQFKNELEAIWDAYSRKERKAMANDKIYYEELGASTTRMKLIGMALNLGNEGNSSKLFGTRPVGIDSTKQWGQQTVIDLLSKHLNKKDWETVQKVWDTVNTIWPDLSKFHAEMTGFEPKKVEATPFDVTLPNGEIVHMEGGYYPLGQDRRASLIAAARDDAAIALQSEKVSALMATTNTGATKQRTNVQYAISLDPSLVNKHIVDVVHDLYFRDLVADYRRMLNNSDFQGTVQSKLGPAGLKAFDSYVRNIANGESYRNVGLSGIESVVDYLRRAGTKAAITFRVGVITQNAANMVLYPKAIDGFGVTDASIGLIKHGLLNYLPKSAFDWKSARKVREEIYNLSPYMRDRRKNPDYSLNDLQRQMFDFDKGKSVSEFGIGLLSGSDDLIAVPMWKQAYEKKLAETGDSKQSAYYADSLIKAVNGSGRKYDVAPIMRSKSVLDKIFTSFYSFMNTEFNRWVRETGILTQDIENVPRFIGFAASRMVVFTIMSDLLAGKGPKDDDDTVAYWAGKIATYPLQLLPVVRDVAPLVINSTLGLDTYGYRSPLALTELENITKAGSKIGSYFYGEGRTTEQDVTESLAKVASYGTGYPDQFNAWFFNLYDYYINGMEPELEDIMKRRNKKERKD